MEGTLEETARELDVQRGRAEERAAVVDLHEARGREDQDGVAQGPHAHAPQETRHPNRAVVVKKEEERRIVGMILSEVGVECAEESGNFGIYADVTDTSDMIRARLGLKEK